MPKPLATTKQSTPELQSLIELFQRLGHSSLEKAIAAQVDCEFYKHLLKRVKANEPVEEFKGIPKAKVLMTLNNLLVKNEKAITDAWELPAKAAALLKTTVKTYKIKSEAIPCYDVTYETYSGENAARIRIVSRRRSVEVVITGDKENLDSLGKSLLIAMLK